MSSIDQLVDWKSNAWKDQNMVAWYSSRMSDRSGAARLYHQIEIDLCERFTVGHEVLDVGIGTGRASLPLAQKGFKITGIDSSQAMLDECNRLAGNVKISLVQGNLLCLPFENFSFDTIMALNVLVHFPNWAIAIADWSKKIRQGGRIIFDIHSLDHLNYFYQRPVKFEELLCGGFGNFMMHVSVEDIVSLANQLDLEIVAIIPYGFVNPSSKYQYLFSQKALNDTHWWRRYLSWIAIDDNLLNFCLFLEKELLHCLTSILTGRFMVVLNKGLTSNSSEINNVKWLQKNIELNKIILERFSLENLSPYLSIPTENWRKMFNAYLKHDYNLVLFYYLWLSFWKKPEIVNLSSFLDEEHLHRVMNWYNGEKIDHEVLSFSKNWSFQEDMEKILNYKGINFGASMEYGFFHDLLQNYYSAF